ncbi:MAG: copper amine oxidase N-terminal domain-containing protein, partial [Clostridia bacterium]|nr:copper amine oxidase N-terminal domain-containing protein [Clostridia bacterium]
MKIKRIVSVILVLVMMISAVSLTSFAADEIKVLLDGQELMFDVPPQLINDRTMVPMRKIFETLGATVSWNSDTETASGVRQG